MSNWEFWQGWRVHSSKPFDALQHYKLAAKVFPFHHWMRQAYVRGLFSANVIEDGATGEVRSVAHYYRYSQELLISSIMYLGTHGDIVDAQAVVVDLKVTMPGIELRGEKQ